MNQPEDWEVIILGAGASGLMCAATAASRGRRVLVVDHARRAGEKIRVSGGGRCNFTHLDAAPHHYLTTDPDFVRAVLNHLPPEAFLARLRRHGIQTVEKTPGQLFCADSAERIVSMLLQECQKGRVRLLLDHAIQQIQPQASGFQVVTNRGTWTTQALVVALGGCSMPKLGASSLGYTLARQFGLKVGPIRPGLTPLTFDATLRALCQELTGIALQATLECAGMRFTDDLLFTHRGLSGPAVLQISSYWRPGMELRIDLTPGRDLLSLLAQAKTEEPGIFLRTFLSRFLPKRLAMQRILQAGGDGRLAEIGDRRLRVLADLVNRWTLTPNGTGGFERAEVTVGGVATAEMDPATLACRKHPGLHFIGELLDVTGWLGGYNLQWAWSSGHAAGLAV
ncbi:MAG: NAD(P)/FAD-dependent oxidoreductase [Magnetococcales bacterium]|nr:NAD(P)/FAD-dependent oxidoreductase [Magnetococcales bacterium]